MTAVISASICLFTAACSEHLACICHRAWFRGRNETVLFAFQEARQLAIHRFPLVTEKGRDWLQGRSGPAYFLSSLTAKGSATSPYKEATLVLSHPVAGLDSICIISLFPSEALCSKGLG